MSDLLKVDLKPHAIAPDSPTNFGDGSGLRGVFSKIDSETIGERVREVRERAQCGMMQARAALEIAGWDVERAVKNLHSISNLPPRSFTWDDARDIATFVRDGLLMIVKGLERKFDLGKK